MTGREKFEAWFRADIEDDDEYSEYGFLMNEDEYRDEKTDIVWAAWQASRRQALAEALQGCKELLAVSGRQARDGDHFEIGREGGHMECVTAIDALANPEGAQG